MVDSFRSQYIIDVLLSRLVREASPHFDSIDNSRLCLGELQSLQVDLSSREERISQLRISSQGGSRYILSPVANIRDADFRGGYFEFHLMIENTGRRDSTVSNYQVDILDLHQSFSNLQPI